MGACARLGRLRPSAGIGWLVAALATVIGPREQPEGAPPVLVSKDGGSARLAVVFDSDPTGAEAIDRLDALRARLPALLRESGLGAPQVLGGGEAAVPA